MDLELTVVKSAAPLSSELQLTQAVGEGGVRGNGRIRADFIPLELTPWGWSCAERPLVPPPPTSRRMACLTLLQAGGPSGAGLRGVSSQGGSGPRDWVGSQTRYSWVSMLWSRQSTGSESQGEKRRCGPRAGSK